MTAGGGDGTASGEGDAERLLDPFQDLLDILRLDPVGVARITVEDATAASATGDRTGDGTREDAGDADDPLGDDTGNDAAGAIGDLGESEADVFLGRSQPQPHGRVFGGQVLAQSVMAAGLTVEPDRPIHSLHAYFLRAGDSSQPIRFAVQRMNDGRSFSARRVHAIQHGHTILSMITSFQRGAGGLDHIEPMPPAPDPESLPTVAQELAGIDHPVARFWSSRRAIDLRHVDGAVYVHPGQDRSARQSVWLRSAEQLPDVPVLHAAVLAYASDYTLLEPVLRRHGLAWSDPRLRAASLDHAMWFHRPARADEWTLYTQTSPSASGGRGLATGRMYARDGTLIASVAQEGMLRIKESSAT